MPGSDVVIEAERLLSGDVWRGAKQATRSLVALAWWSRHMLGSAAPIQAFVKPNVGTYRALLSARGQVDLKIHPVKDAPHSAQDVIVDWLEAEERRGVNAFVVGAATAAIFKRLGSLQRTASGKGLKIWAVLPTTERYRKRDFGPRGAFHEAAVRRTAWMDEVVREFALGQAAPERTYERVPSLPDPLAPSATFWRELQRAHGMGTKRWNQDVEDAFLEAGYPHSAVVGLGPALAFALKDRFGPSLDKWELRNPREWGRLCVTGLLFAYKVIEIPGPGVAEFFIRAVESGSAYAEVALDQADTLAWDYLDRLALSD